MLQVEIYPKEGNNQSSQDSSTATGSGARMEGMMTDSIDTCQPTKIKTQSTRRPTPCIELYLMLEKPNAYCTIHL
ncbi:hypothetical protein WAI453_011397 [Rhynchosporium graminicola]